MSGEHPSERLIERYVAGSPAIAAASSPAVVAVGEPDAPADELWALEAHLEACRVCRDRLSVVVPARAPAVATLVGTVWSGLEPRLTATSQAPRRRRLGVRLPVRLSGWLTPVMVPWLAMAASVTVIALLLDLFGTGGGTGRVPLVLLLAPVLPVLGVAASWSRGLDPAYELTASVPGAGLPLVLRRTASVLAVLVPALLVGGWVTGVMVAQWLLPCLTFTSATLALGGLVGVTRAAVALVAVWAAVIVAPGLATTSGTVFTLRDGSLPVWGLLLALATGVVIARRGAYFVLGTHR
ncbi:zf-HC2 domain-containing protein [Streptomyces sp. LP05-1]|uniref:Zf-HC2 domain-containing protein n=1 Tax=Streptomyces pyxinae TaxID=2970734 RepID=A0ABT2CQT7_9ACTN|nr:zf-HC2 domain-containing protein [Streptomyces sp. LP05-1]MCS0639804.1 zf-HC2 domain-containing protein [Streptomyces sp. LP05-1]